MTTTCPQTLKPRPIIGFIALTTILLLGVGGLVKAQKIALDLDIAARLPPPSPYWHGCVALIGLLLPIVLRVRYRQSTMICQVLNGYLWVFIAQIISELVMTPLFLRGIAVMIGSVYSVFRLLQLWQSQAWVAKGSRSRPGFRVFLWGLMVIWGINLLRFILYRWPLLLP